VVLPVALAEILARLDVQQWFDTPKKDGTSRSAGFDARIPFLRMKRIPRRHDELLRKTLHEYEERWDILQQSESDLSNPDLWSLSAAGR
jgi:hypothetical protein